MNALPKADDIFRHIGAIQGGHSHLFAGREKVVDSILAGLELSGAVPVIFGERGIGKSSAAWRVFEILKSKSSNPSYRDVNPTYRDVASKFDLDDTYVPLWVECADWFSGIESALLALLTPKGVRQAVTIPDLYPNLLTPEDVVKADASFELNLAMLKIKTSLTSSEEKDNVISALQASNQKILANPIEMFSQICGRLIDLHPNSTIVIFIDEFDRLTDSNLVGSVLKTFTRIRFVIVGVAASAEKLIGSHPSVGRKIVGVEVPPFDRSESQQIFDNATTVAKRFEGSKGMFFSDQFVDQVHNDTGGYPNLIQKVGFNTIHPDRLHRKMLSDRIEIGLDRYRPALKAMFKAGVNRGASEEEVEKTIAETIGESTRRTGIIRAIVDFGSQWVNFATLVSRLDKKHQPQLQENLKIFVDGGILEVRRDDDFRFKSPLFLMASRLYLESVD